MIGSIKNVQQQAAIRQMVCYIQQPEKGQTKRRFQNMSGTGINKSSTTAAAAAKLRLDLLPFGKAGLTLCWAAT